MEWRPDEHVPQIGPVPTDDVESGEEPWHVGRAGMRYRDLLPGRWNGRVIASHIAIPGGGPVPDYVHHHDVRFQIIHCRTGWVRLVYEGQGEPFVLRAGDTVLQPRTFDIGCSRRHRTSESSRSVPPPSTSRAPIRRWGFEAPPCIPRITTSVGNGSASTSPSGAAPCGPTSWMGIRLRQRGRAATGGVGDVLRFTLRSGDHVSLPTRASGVLHTIGGRSRS
ncbi:MAG: hypothetical protein R2715_22875 [Ilumatobacteraceae bacterium]